MLFKECHKVEMDNGMTGERGTEGRGGVRDARLMHPCEDCSNQIPQPRLGSRQVNTRELNCKSEDKLPEARNFDEEAQLT